MYNKRIGKLRESIAKQRIDGLLVSQINNIFYLTGFTGSTAFVLITKNSSYILVDSRYKLQAKNECSSFKIIEYSAQSTVNAVADLLNEYAVGRVGYEAESMSVSLFRNLKPRLETKLKLFATGYMVEKLRFIKDEYEISLIKKAAIITDSAFSQILPQIKPGVTEKELALLIDTSIRKLGADINGFETIVAFGANAACPHHRPTNTVIKEGGMVKLDFGACKDKYNADITRTVFVGEPDKKFKDIYKIVLDTQLKAIEAIKPGIKGSYIDSVARNYIISCGYGDNFGHGLGHGLGIDVHDGPAFSKSSDIIINEGMVATVEPGIYIENWGGIRIEDDILVTSSGVEIITSSEK